MNDESKIRLIHIWEILKRETDEENSMPSTVLLQKLKETGLSCRRQTLYADIATLNKYGFKVLCKRTISNEYYVKDRDFRIPEIQILIDAVHGTPCITKKKSKVLIDKLAALAGARQGEVMKKGLIEYDATKGNNEGIYYSISEIAKAIEKKKKTGFFYLKLDMNGRPIKRKRSSVPDEERWYVVNPVKTIFQDGKYYLICYDDFHGKLSQYRIDRMECTTMLDEDIAECRESETAELIKHRKSLIGMYGGRIEQVTFVADEAVMDSVYDKFGMEVKPYRTKDDKVEFKVNVQIGIPLLAWVIGFGSYLKVTAPASVIGEIKELLDAANKNYT